MCLRSDDDRRPSMSPALWWLTAVHLSCLFLCGIAAVSASSKACSHLPQVLRGACNCVDVAEGVELQCKEINSTKVFVLETEDGQDNENSIGGGDFNQNYQRLLGHSVRAIRIRDSSLDCVNIRDFDQFANLDRLSVTQSSIKRVICDEPPLAAGDVVVSASKQRVQSPLVHRLQALDLSSNDLTELSDKIGELHQLRELNVSGNQLTQLRPVFRSLRSLSVLDLSSNNLDEHLNPKVLQQLPESLTYLDISNNSWTCSPSLSWLFDWATPLVDSGTLRRLNDTRCRYEDTQRHYGNLILVMEHYSKYVKPSCPVRDNCHCLLTNVQEKMYNSKIRAYSVEVKCVGQGLKHFPKLPKHTRTVDLSGNYLNDTAFALLNVSDHNYDMVDNMTVDGNMLEELPEKLLEMKLGLSFSVKNNKLTSIPYDFSQFLLHKTKVIFMAQNPWKCTCSSSITDLNLIAKIKDKNELRCGKGSEAALENKLIVGLNPELLCPPENNTEFQELLLQLLCVLLSILIVIVFSKLAYDYYHYRTRGQLPWLVLKMP